MIDSPRFNLMAALNKFFVETLSENKHEFEKLSEDDPIVVSFDKMGIVNGLAIHINKNHQLVGITLKSEQYFPEPVQFHEGFQEIFTPLLESHATPLAVARALMPFDEVEIKGIWLDIPVSTLFLSIT